MSKLILYTLLIWCYIISPTGAGTFTSITSYLTYNNVNNQYEKALKDKEEQIRIKEEKEKQDAIDAEIKLNTFLNYKRFELKNYGFVNIPMSHFKINRSISDKLQFIYLDNISYIDINYKIYVTEEDIHKLKNDNNVETLEFNDYCIIRKAEEKKSDEFTKVKWYCIMSDSYLIIDANISPDTNYEAFIKCVDNLSKTLKIYYLSNYVFDTPTTGYYSTETEQEDTDKDNTNKVTDEGIIKTDKITNDWKDLELILNQNKISLNSKVQDIIDLGYSIKNKNDYIYSVKPNEIYNMTMYNQSGAIINISAINQSEKDITIEEMTVYNIEIKAEDFKDTQLPELILPCGITWSIKNDKLIEVLGERVTKNILPNGDVQITYEYDNKKLEFLNGGFSTIKEVKMSIDISQ